MSTFSNHEEKSPLRAHPAGPLFRNRILSYPDPYLSEDISNRSDSSCASSWVEHFIPSPLAAAQIDKKLMKHWREAPCEIPTECDLEGHKYRIYWYPLERSNCKCLSKAKFLGYVTWCLEERMKSHFYFEAANRHIPPHISSQTYPNALILLYPSTRLAFGCGNRKRRFKSIENSRYTDEMQHARFRRNAA